MRQQRKRHHDNASSLTSGHLTPADTWRVSWQGISSRPQRSFLAGLGIAVGVAALVSLTGISESNHVALLEELDAMGANLLVVEGAPGLDGNPVPLPPSAVDSIARQEHVASVGGLQYVPSTVHAYRSDLISEGETNGLTVAAATPELLEAVGGTLDKGQWFSQASRRLPTVVLGAEAAQRLGSPEIGDLLWIGDQWYPVLGIMNPLALADTINTTVLLGDTWVTEHFSQDPLATGIDVGDWTQIYVQSQPGQVDALKKVLSSAASPGSPFVAVAALSDIGGGREVADSMLGTLGLALGGIALAVGGVGIANTMVVSVMERRGEIGLRRALGARGSQIALQFVTEAAVLSLMGALGGMLAGAVIAGANSYWNHQPFVLSPQMVRLGLIVAVAVGACAGLQPAAKAARMAPMDALRAS